MLSFFLQPVHVVEFDILLVFASRVVSLADRRLQEERTDAMIM